MALEGYIESRFAHSYYWLHCLLLSTYPVFRSVFDISSLQTRDAYSFGLTRETQFFACVAIFYFMKLPHMITWDARFANLFTHLKFCILVIGFLADIRMFLFYLTLVAIFAVFVSQPEYDLRTKSKVVTLDSNSFFDITHTNTKTQNTENTQSTQKTQSKTRNRKHNKNKDKQKVKETANTSTSTSTSEPEVWIVMCYSIWADTCLQFTPIFGQLSLEYGGEKIRFARLDVGRNAGIAKQYKINLSVQTKQLPTLIYFKNGKEIDRIPRVKDDGTLHKMPMTLRNIVLQFNLQKD